MQLVKFIEENPDQMELVKQIIKMYEADQREFYRDRCQVCGQKFSREEEWYLRSHDHLRNDFWRTCTRHRQYACQFQLPRELEEARYFFSSVIFGEQKLPS